MRNKTVVILLVPIFLLASIVFNSSVYAVEERKVLSRNYVGLGVEVYAPYQGDASESITIRVRVEALEDIKNVSVTLFLWGSKTEGSTPWGTSFIVLDLTDFPNGTIREEAYNITIPSDIDPGLTYGILFLEWSIYRSTSWESQWDKASFRVTFVRNRDYENLQELYDQLEGELSNLRILTYIFAATTMALAMSTVYFAKKRS